MQQNDLREPLAQEPVKSAAAPRRPIFTPILISLAALIALVSALWVAIVDDPQLKRLIAKHQAGGKPMDEAAMTDRLFLPMLLEATRVLEEGIVREPGDVDMGLILGIGFPAWRGGLLRWADSLGLPAVLGRLKKYEALGPRYAPTEQIKKMAAEGRGFYGA